MSDDSSKESEGASEHADRKPTPHKRPRPTRASAAWTAVIVAVVLLILLIVFIAQNARHVRISFLWWHGDFAVGLALLVAAVAGACVALLVGSARIRELRQRSRLRAQKRTARSSKS